MYFRIFDCWRFSAAMLVMTYHYLFWAPGGGQEVTDFLRRLLPLLDLFFMISGFFITTRYVDRVHSVASFAEFFRRRVARLYPLHLMTTLFFAAVAVMAWAMQLPRYGYHTELAALPYHLLGLHALGTISSLDLNYVSWSVSAEFFSYAMFPLIVVVLRYGGFAGLLAYVCAYLGLLEILSHNGVFPSGHWTSADTLGAYRAFADFSIGALIARFVARSTIKLASPWPGLLVIALAVLAMIDQMPWFVTFPMVATAVTLSAIAETNAPDSTRYLAFAMPVTCAAFGIYIWHPVMEFVFLTFIWDQWLGATGAVNFYAYLLLPVGATIMVAVVSAHFIEPRLSRLVSGPSSVDKRKPAALAAA